MATTQANRAVRIRTPLSTDALLFFEMTAVHELSRPFQFDLSLLSPDGNLDANALLGKDVSIELDLPAGRVRHFHGVVTQFAQVGWVDKLHQYQATVRPWLWFLSRTADCRIFQNQTVPQIAEKVFREYGFTDYDLRLKGKYRTWEYCTQYRETDLNFVGRLLEQEGIYYFFEHTASKHVLVLADDPAVHEAVKGYEEVPFYPPTEASARRERDHLSTWISQRSVQPGAYALQDFDVKAPNQPPAAKAVIQRKHARSEFEIFDYPGEFTEPKDGKAYARIRIEELQAEHHVTRADGDAVGLDTGHVFTLENHPRGDENRQYLITSSTLRLSNNRYRSGVAGGAGQAEAHVSIQCIDAKTPYRPPRITPKPVISGTQTAIVVGKAGEEIWTDPDGLGRVKVQFHWDRYGNRDENSSCWVRVAQLWAGRQWGAIHLPRVGQEVIVSFLEGDPDRPIITGRVYNGESKPPYSLPANKTQSGIKSRTSPDSTAGGFNELRFEDLKDKEEIYIHAQRDLTAVIENDQSITIKHDETVEIKNKRTAKVGADEEVTVGKNRTTTIGENEERTIKQNRKETVKGEEALEVGKNRKQKVGDNDTHDVGKNYKLTAGDQITLETGAARIVMKKNGDIEISGKNIKIQATAKIDASGAQEIKASGTQVKVQGTAVDVKGTKTSVEGSGMLDLKASGVASVKGTITKIG